MKFLCLILGFLIPSLSYSATSLGGRDIDSSDTVVLGGSFSPPTIEHAGVLSRVLQRFGFSEGRMLVALPYKVGAAPAEVSLDLTQISVENFDEILDLYSIDYRNFKSVGRGRSTFNGADGKSVSISVDDFDIRNQVREDTLKTLEYLAEQKGDAKKVFWISGGDSFASVSTWTPGSEDWKKLFEKSNWIVVSRPGFDQGEKQINFYRSNPLEPIFDASFLSRYIYSYDEVNLVHRYQNRDATKPDIFVINQVALNDSSSLNRKSLAEIGDHDHAQAGLQPSVFAKCLSEGLYSSEESAEQYRLFSRKNLSIFLKWLRTNIEKTNHEKRLDPEDQKAYALMLSALVDSTQVLSTELNQRSQTTVFRDRINGLKENLRVLSSRKSFNQRFSELVAATGAKSLALALIIGQVLEFTLIPATMAHLYGAPGLATAPAFQTEFLILPTWLGWKLFKSYREKTRLAGGLKTYALVNDYLNQLLRGDPQAIDSRIELYEGSGFGNSSLTLNLIRSRLPKWVPLALRRWDDRRIRWHDLNISTNELKAILRDPTLVSLLQESANHHEALFSDLLFVAAQKTNERRWKLNFLLGHRYFHRLYLGDISDELLGGFTESERIIIEDIGRKNRKLANILPSKELEFLGDTVSDIYSVLRIVSSDRSTLHAPDFWTIILNFMATRYPDTGGRLLSDKGIDWLSKYLPILAESLILIAPEIFEDTSVQYNGHTLLKFQNHKIIFLDPDLDKKVKENQSQQSLEEKRFKNTVSDYIREHRDIFRSALESSEDSGFQILPVHSRGQDIDEGNIAWEITQYAHYADHRNHTLTLGFENALKRLESQPRHNNTELAFRDAFSLIQSEIQRSLKGLEDIKFLWAKEKLIFHTGLNNYDESQIPFYEETLAKFEASQKTLDHFFRKISTLNGMMMGTEPLDVRNFESVQRALESILGEKNKYVVLGDRGAKRLVKKARLFFCSKELRRLQSGKI